MVGNFGRSYQVGLGRMGRYLRGGMVRLQGGRGGRLILGKMVWVQEEEQGLSYPRESKSGRSELITLGFSRLKYIDHYIQHCP